MKSQLALLSVTSDMEQRNATLDLWRSTAIIFVINCHVAGEFLSQPELSFLRLGGVGVDLFFVLSGWLLGKQLLVELRDTGTIDVRRFWLRRWLRTLPAYYAVLLLVYGWQVLGRHNYDLDYSFLVFLQTYREKMTYFNVSWSLCVEEHFYFAVAPFLLLFFRARWARLAVLPCLLLLPTLCRHFGWYENLGQTHVRWDQCAVGVALAAIAVFAPRSWRVLCRWAPCLMLGSLAIAAVNVLARVYPAWGVEDFGPLPWALIFMCWVLLANSSTFWTTRLRVPGARFLANRAYALYLIHGEAFAVLKRTSTDWSFPLLLVAVWIVSLLFSEILYRCVERPFMQAREYLSVSCSRRSQPLVADHDFREGFLSPEKSYIG